MSTWRGFSRAEDVRWIQCLLVLTGGQEEGVTVRALQLVADLTFVGDGEILTEQSTFCVWAKGTRITTVHKNHDKPA